MPEARIIPLPGGGSRSGPAGRSAGRTRSARDGDPTGPLDAAVPGPDRGSSAGPEALMQDPVSAAAAEFALAWEAGAEVGAEAGAQAGAEPGVQFGVDVPEWERRLADALAFLRRRITGDYEVDEFGFDPELTDTVLAAAFRPLYDRWFRVETRGLENIPDEGSALVVANHSGTIPLDAIMTSLAILDHHPRERHLRTLAADLVFDLPFLAPLARKAGNTLACNADAERLLGAGELVGVWPEGFKGIGKPFADRYKLQRFGRGGFVAAALRTGAPIIPCSIVGAEETYPMLGNAKTIARLLGLPYLPVTPTFPLLGPLGLVPLPSKWIIEFGEPVETEHLGAAAAEDPMLVFSLTDQVRETIQQTLYTLLMQRRSVFF